jgi:hypothetical protein
MEPRITDEDVPPETDEPLDDEARPSPEQDTVEEEEEALGEEPAAPSIEGVEAPVVVVGTPRAGRGKGLLRALPWALFVLALAAAVVFAIAWRGVQSREHQRTEVASIATQFLQALTNFGGPTIDRDVAEIRSYAIGDFANQVATFFDDATVSALRSANAVSVGHVESVFIESLSGDTAEAFGVVNETLSNAKTAAHPEVLRVDVEMVMTPSGWKVDRVTLLQSPGGFPSG